MRVAGDLLRDELRHALDDRVGAGLPGAFRSGVSHLLHMTIGGVIQHEYLGHQSVLDYWGEGYPAPPRPCGDLSG